MIRSLTRRGWVVTTLLTAFIAGFVALILSSPWLVRMIVPKSENWHDLSEIGQAYGGVSAILSGLAFCGIAGSLVLQWRQVQHTQTMTGQCCGT